MTLLIFILILSILVLVHELGHFIAAKKSGVLVEEFGFGLPPRLFGIKFGETLYSINLLPFGGFIKVYGEEYHEEDKKNITASKKLKARAFIYKKPWQKIMIIIAGVVMNILLGVFIYYALLSYNNFRAEPIPLINNYNFPFGNEEKRVIVTNILQNSPAQKAGIDVRDVVLRFKIEENIDEGQWIDIQSPEKLINLTNQAQDKNVFIELINAKNGQQKVVDVVPIYNKELKRATIGINLMTVVILKYDRLEDKIFSGFFHSYNLLAYNASAISYFIGSAFKEKSLEPVSHTVSGPVGIFAVVSDIVQSSGKKLLINLSDLVALLSLSLAFVNILPLPALDGGRLVFIGYEVIAKKRVNKNVEKYFNLIGIIFILSLAVLVAINDIMKFYR